MKYKIAICDDSGTDRQFVLNMVRAWASSAGHTVHIDDFPSAESFLFRYAEESDYDILLLDIEMGAMDGVTMAKELRKSNDTVQIIFITGYSDYISEGYEVAALHYLMKPVKEEKLRSVLDRAVEKITKNERVLHFEAGGEMVRVPIYQIRYADVLGNYVTVSHAGAFTTLYAHCSRITASSGQQVALGDPIAEVGETGNATGPHLHFAIQKDTVYLDPAYYGIG